MHKVNLEQMEHQGNQDHQVKMGLTVGMVLMVYPEEMEVKVRVVLEVSLEPPDRMEEMVTQGNQVLLVQGVIEVNLVFQVLEVRMGLQDNLEHLVREEMMVAQEMMVYQVRMEDLETKERLVILDAMEIQVRLVQQANLDNKGSVVSQVNRVSPANKVYKAWQVSLAQQDSLEQTE